MVVIGGGDSAMEDSIFISKFASELTIVHRRDEFRASKIMQERAEAIPNISLKTPYVPEEFVAGDDGKLAKVRLRHAETGEVEELEVGGAFVAIGHTPRSELVSDQVDTDERGLRARPGTAPPGPTWRASSPSATWSTTPTARRSPPPAPAAWARSTPSGTCATRLPRRRRTGPAGRRGAGGRAAPPSVAAARR